MPTAAVIGPEGGTLRVSDPASPIRGTSLHIPPGALATPTHIQIQVGAHACSFGLTPTVKISPEGLRFKYPVEIRVPIDGSHLADPDITMTCYTYNESDDRWLRQEDGMVNAENGVATCRLEHL
jgi:hypothetical protein